MVLNVAASNDSKRVVANGSGLCSELAFGTHGAKTLDFSTRLFFLTFLNCS
jgi:hypothetical protein